jgi:DNA-binding XRE family transcriptional regulator
MNDLAQTMPDVSHDPRRVVAKAAVNAARELGLSQRELGGVIGVSEATVSRMRDGGYALPAKPYELAACLIRVFRSLDAIAGGDPATITGWMTSPNNDLSGVPKEMIATAPGLVTVMNYLDAARAPV